MMNTFPGLLRRLLLSVFFTFSPAGLPDVTADGYTAAMEQLILRARSVVITLPPGIATDTVRDAVKDARQAIEEAIREQREAAQAAREAEQAAREAEQAARQAAEEAGSVTGPTSSRRLLRISVSAPSSPAFARSNSAERSTSSSPWPRTPTAP